MRLHLVGSAPAREPAEGDVFAARSHRLASAPQRPGELGVPVWVNLDGDARSHVGEGCERDRLPATLWLTIAIEGQRCLTLASRTLEVSASEAAATLDKVAATIELTQRDFPAVAQLRAYARAVLTGDRSAASMLPASLPLTPALHVAGAWALTAQTADQSVKAWASAVAAARPAGRARWEAASAAAGQTLAEWAVVQAARRCRRSSTSAHSHA